VNLICPTQIWKMLIILGLALFGVGCSPVAGSGPPTDYEVGEVIRGEDTFGTFYLYVPTTGSAKPDIVVLVHGTPAEEETAEATARYYLLNWLDFAEEQGLVLIAPAFNQEDFSSRKGDHALGGYRGLFGRQIAADEWVLRLVRAYQESFGTSGRQFYLYGHSAGGQFAARFLVTHPEVVNRAVISSAATYPQPDPNVAWPFGMGELQADVEWDQDTIKQVDVVANKEKWLAATQIPLTMIVGLNDTSSLPQFPGQQGRNRLAIGRNWVRDMAAFAEANGLECQFQLEMVPGKGHSMSGLMSYTQPALVDQMEID